jgi:hypothetical protein
MTTAASTTGATLFSVIGRIRSAQPNGVHHSSHLVACPESAIIRTTKATPNTAMPNPVATRRDRPSWDVNAPAAKNTAGTSVTLSPYIALSPKEKPTSGSRPASAVNSVVPANTTAIAPPTPLRVASVARDALVPPASESCQLPLSSSPRSSLVAASSAQIAPIVVRVT